MHKETDWEKAPDDRKRGHKIWDHRGAHEINDGEVDGDIEFGPEVLGTDEDSESDE